MHLLALSDKQVVIHAIVHVNRSDDLVDTDGAVISARDDLTTVGGHCDAIHDLAVAREATVFGHSFGDPEFVSAKAMKLVPGPQVPDAGGIDQSTIPTEAIRDPSGEKAASRTPSQGWSLHTQFTRARLAAWP
jgi:hypothetical protein